MGGIITKASTYTLAINGSFEAGPYQVFSGFASGDVTFGKGAVEYVTPEWWGAKGDANGGGFPVTGTDDAVPLQCALSTALPTHLMPGKTYRTSVGLTATALIEGNVTGYGSAGINYTGAGSALTTTSSFSGYILTWEDTSIGLEVIPNAKEVKYSGDIYNMTHLVTNTGKSLYINATTGFINNVYLERLTLYGSKYGLYVAGGAGGGAETQLTGKGVLITGIGKTLAGSRGIYTNAYAGTAGGVIEGYIESFDVGIEQVERIPANSGGGISFYGTIEGVNTEWTVGSAFTGKLYNDLNGSWLNQTGLASPRTQYSYRESKVGGGPYYQESYYSQKHLVSADGGRVEFGIYHGGDGYSFIDGITPYPLGGFSTDGSSNISGTWVFVGLQKIAWWSEVPTTYSWRIGDIIWNTAPASGGATPNGWRCLTSGTFSPAETTGGITIGTTALTVASAAGFSIGDYITIVGVIGIKRINHIAGLVFTLDAAADATVADADVVTPEPTFASMGVLP